MRRTVTISLPEALTVQLDEVATEEQTSRSEVVREALRRYLDQQEFRRIRRQMLAEAEARGIITDEDVFERVS
jgi:metal-responsive CopG/Arc/MetJ family transcriptional regulator